MARLNWGESGNNPYTAGVDHGVFYPKGGAGHAWNGLVTVDELAAEANQSLIYIDGVGHQNRLLTGNFAATISAMTYPIEFEEFDGYSENRSGQRRKVFDLCYRTMHADGQYLIHLVYNALARPSTHNNATVSDTAELDLFSWELTTTPEIIPDIKSSSHFIIDTAQVNPGLVEDLEARLYGTEASLASMPTVTELLWIFEENAVFRVTDNGDGTATISGPDTAVYSTGVDSAMLSWPSVIQLSDDTYQLKSL